MTPARTPDGLLEPCGGVELSHSYSLLLARTPHAGPVQDDIGLLFDGIPFLTFKKGTKTRIGSIATDSRRVPPGALFFALPGLRTDGHLYVNEAVSRGAVAVVSEKPPPPDFPVAYIQVSDARSTLAEVSRRFHGNPTEALDLVGITGTNGKTTVAYLTQYLLNGGSQPVGMLGTIKYDLGGRTLPAYRTTPDVGDIYSLLAQMKGNGCRHAVMEVSSHGIVQKRIEGLEFKVAAFLNLTQDHIDYHRTLEDYFGAKAQLFDGRTGSLPEIAVVNRDDPYGRRLLERIPADCRILTFGLNGDPDFFASDLRLEPAGSFFTLNFDGRSISVETSLPGIYNIYNLLAAFAVGRAAGRDLEELVERVRGFPGVPGRMERVDEGQPYNVFVDYAHTDDALRNALRMLRGITPGRLFVVFGCGGNRDRKKRPLMTRAVMEHADHSWATSDNPRGEQPSAIFEDMKTGVIDPDRITFVEDRRRAINLALDAAEEGDCVLIAGKGHETFQEFADTVLPFDDRHVARTLLQTKNLTRF